MSSVGRGRSLAGRALGAPAGDLRPDAHFTDLGGDSLSALTFANLLHEIFDIDVPVGVIVSPATDRCERPSVLALLNCRGKALNRAPRVAPSDLEHSAKVSGPRPKLDHFCPPR